MSVTHSPSARTMAATAGLTRPAVRQAVPDRGVSAPAIGFLRCSSPTRSASHLARLYRHHHRPARRFVGFENFQYLLSDPLVERGVLQRAFYTGSRPSGNSRSVPLALLLNNHFPFKSLLRAIVLLPGSCRPWRRRWRSGGSTIRNSRSSYLLVDVPSAPPISTSWERRGRRVPLIAANIWRGIPCRDLAAAGLQTISPSLYEAAMLTARAPGSVPFITSR